MAKKNKDVRHIRVEGKKIIMTFKDSGKHKMDEDELKNHLHLIKTGHRAFANKTKYNRKEKHRNSFA